MRCIMQQKARTGLQRSERRFGEVVADGEVVVAAEASVHLSEPM